MAVKCASASGLPAHVGSRRLNRFWEIQPIWLGERSASIEMARLKVGSFVGQGVAYAAIPFPEFVSQL